MQGSASDIDIGYNTTKEFWDEIVLAAAGRFEAQPTRAHALACAIYMSHFLAWVFDASHPGEDRHGAVYAEFQERHRAACPELAWLAGVAEVPARRKVFLRQQSKDDPTLVLQLADGTGHRFGEVVAKAIAYWRFNL